MPNLTYTIHKRNGDIAGKVVIAVGTMPTTVEESMEIFDGFITRLAATGVQVNAVPNLAVSELPPPITGGGHIPAPTELPMEWAMRDIAE